MLKVFSSLYALRIHLMELSPPSFRTFVVGTSYQLGNLVSSASSTIEATIGQRFPLPPKKSGSKIIERYQYGKVICIFLACVRALGPLLYPRADSLTVTSG
jgi:SHS family lactate transporter-like MFS transporter